MTFAPVNSNAFYLDPSIIYPETNDQQFKEVLREAYYKTASCVNGREISIYPLNEIINGKQYYTVGNPQKFRQVYRKCFDIGAIATGATSTTAHGISSITEFVVIAGDCVTDVVDYRPIPYASATAVNQQIEIRVTATNIIIVNGAASPNITKCSVTLEYLKN